VTKRSWFLFWRDTGAAERPSEPRFFEASARFEDVVEGWREANLNGNRGRLLCSLNTAFARIVQHLQTLQKTGRFNSQAAKFFPSFTQELQAEFNQEFLENLHQLELDDWGHYGKARDKYEKHLRDPDDVFIHAKERKKQLAKQRKKR
jgi:hypothetical protein